MRGGEEGFRLFPHRIFHFHQANKKREKVIWTVRELCESACTLRSSSDLEESSRSWRTSTRKRMRAGNGGGLAEALNPILPRRLIKGFTEFRPLLLLRLSWASSREKQRKRRLQRAPVPSFALPPFIRQY